MAGSLSTPSSKVLSAENFARVLARIEELEAQATSPAATSSINPATPSPLAVSSSDLSQLEARLTAKFEAKFATQTQTIQQQTETIQQQAEMIQQQARKLQSVDTKSMILRAKLDGRDDTFYLFPMLPAELQRMVWKQALLPGRVIEVRLKGRDFLRTTGQLQQLSDANGYHYTTAFPCIFDVSPKLEVLLFTCQESRRIAEARKPPQYCFSFTPAPCYTFFAADEGPNDKPIPHEFIAKWGVPFRPRLDLIYLRCRDDTEWSLLQSPIVDGAFSGFKAGEIVNLAVDIQFCGCRGFLWKVFFSPSQLSFGFFEWRQATLLAKLERLILMNGFGSDVWSKGIVFKNISYSRFFTPELLKAAVVKEFAEPSYIAAPIIEIMTEEELMALR